MKIQKLQKETNVPEGKFDFFSFEKKRDANKIKSTLIFFIRSFDYRHQNNKIYCEQKQKKTKNYQ